MAERFLEQQPAICATLLSPEVRKGQSDLCTLNETDVSNAEDANMTGTIGDSPMIHAIKNAITTDLLKRGVTEEAASLENERTLRRTEVIDGPPAPKRKASSSSLLVSLLGRSFTDTEGTAEPKIPYAIAEEEIERYCKVSSLPLTEDPLNWWRDHEITFPLLSQVSKRYLCIPGTSVSAERVFSTAGDVVTAKRSTLKPEHVDQLVFLQKNLHIPKC
ncbi:hypothetical protein KUCAC02_030298 [Chaenocephalus aceratus]|uniref:Uncharacterized protein n=1 Tax=Chaenocephalus aceratus TaxID=36190 RepID=A0ACB9XJ25_CHAAC|nr:hypothetical protein KUCAC02_030298 [Chaenocephalus aceratus]